MTVISISEGMRMFVGTKAIKAGEMSRGDYNRYRGWEVPADEDPTDEGFLVEYLDSPNSNHPDHEGYLSWSPKSVFEDAYKASGEMSFSQALECIKRGMKMARAGWNGKNMFVFLVSGSRFQVNRPPLLGIYEEGTEINYHAHIDMRTADGTIVPWLASQTDVLAEDWGIVA